MNPARLKGLLLGILAALLWGAFSVLARRAALAGYQPIDLVALRFGAASLILLPVAWQARKALREAGFWRLLVLAVLGGAPNVLAFMTGLHFTPASQGSTITPITVAISGTLIAIPVLGEKPTRGRVLALAVMALGVALIGIEAFLGNGLGGAVRGWPFLLLAGVTYGAFTVLLRYWRIPAIPVTAGITLISAGLLWPFWAPLRLDILLAFPAWELLWHAISLGVFCGALATLFYARAAELLGAAGAATIPAIVPVAALLLGIPALGEWPGTLQIMGMSCAIGGMAGAVLLTGRRSTSAA
ncbi:DMT family transporter [Acetobacteraceae bacterium H6797]|nr:DMT family transporter [Acetobacteraceae bacterium H6797]